MAKIEDIIKKIKELKTQEERINYLEGLLKVVKDRDLTKKLEELLKVVKDTIKDEKPQLVQEEPFARNPLQQSIEEIKYERQQRTPSSRGLERTVEETPKTEETGIPHEYIVRTHYHASQQQRIREQPLREQTARRNLPREIVRDTPYIPELQESQRETYMQGNQELKEIDIYRPQQEFTPTRVRDILERDEKRKEVKWKLSRREA